MRKLFLLGILLIVCRSIGASASVKVTDVAFANTAHQGQITVTFEGSFKGEPTWDISGRVLKLTLSDAQVNKSFNKRMSQVSISAINKEKEVEIQTVFPETIKRKAEDLSVTIQNNKIILTTPVSVALNATKKAPFVPAPVVAVKLDKSLDQKMTKDLLNEEYLKDLEQKNEAKNTPKLADIKPVAAVKTTEDRLSIKQASIDNQTQKKAGSSEFSFSGYVAKFIAFLGVVLLLFYGVVSLMKKGVLSKGRLSFLNGGQLVSVLSTTYIAPKRSLLVVKVNNQAFLLSSSEGGISFLSEIQDVPGIVKESEKLVAGDNFDGNLEDQKEIEHLESKIKIKENIHESKPERGLAKLVGGKDIVRFSDELKKKVKNLKPLQ